jgi:prepilin-type N-terminal cleavage/methylation domain-containing protein
MRSTPHTRCHWRCGGGFTLVELLAVIAVIAILASLLFPAIQSMMQAARRRKAAVEAKALVNAIKSYRNTYGRYPLQSQGAKDATYPDDINLVTDTVGIKTKQWTIVGPLLPGDPENPRQITFLEISPQSVKKDKTGSSYYADPWGRPYVIALDESGDQRTCPTNQLAGAGYALRYPWTGDRRVLTNETVVALSWGSNPPKKGNRKVTSWTE